jgi:hypothetical protein
VNPPGTTTLQQSGTVADRQGWCRPATHAATMRTGSADKKGIDVAIENLSARNAG